VVVVDDVVVVEVLEVEVVVVGVPVSITSCGRFVPVLFSRLGKLLLVLLVVSTAREMIPLPRPETSDVTSQDNVLLAAIGTDEATADPSGVGLLL